jgi:CheY-like chemotaxis protein
MLAPSDSYLCIARATDHPAQRLLRLRKVCATRIDGRKHCAGAAIIEASRRMKPARTILVVDDDPEIRESIADLLRDEGYQVAVASHGGEALEQVRNGARPDLIVLDLMMPVMDGWQFLDERTRDAALRAIPVVVVSATPETLQPPDTCAFIRKPMRLDDLLDVVARALAS